MMMHYELALREAAVMTCITLHVLLLSATFSRNDCCLGSDCITYSLYHLALLT